MKNSKSAKTALLLGMSITDVPDQEILIVNVAIFAKRILLSSW